MYDIKGEGRIGRRDLYAVLKRMVGDNIHDEQLWQLVDKIILDSKRDREPTEAELQYVTRDDFEWAMRNADLKQRLSVRIPSAV